VLARQRSVGPAPIAGRKAQFASLADGQPLSPLVVGPRASGEVVARVFVDHRHLVGELINNQQIRGVGVLFTRLIIIGSVTSILGGITLDIPPSGGYRSDPSIRGCILACSYRGERARHLTCFAIHRLVVRKHELIVG
jgi:hypothetical protein